MYKNLISLYILQNEFFAALKLKFLFILDNLTILHLTVLHDTQKIFILSAQTKDVIIPDIITTCKDGLALIEIHNISSQSYC